jgi:serine/threonine protein kinase
MFKVKVAIDETTNTKYAAKICKDSFSKHRLSHEAGIISSLNQAGVSNIIKLIEYIEPEQSSARRRNQANSTETANSQLSYQCKAAMIMELAPNETLFEYVLASKGFDEKMACSIFKELMKTIGQIHSLGYVHRDVKLENILIDESFRMKLADFGFARSFDDTNKEKMTTRLGTEYYIAPEMRRYDPYSGMKIDMFSCGVVLFLLVFGRPPFRQASSIDPLYRYFSDDQSQNFWEKTERVVNGGKECNMALKLLLSDLLSSDPSKRPTAEKVLQYEWMQQDLCSDQELETYMMKIKKPSGENVPRG